MAESLNCAFYKYMGDPRVANKSLGSSVHSCALIKPLEPLSDIEVRLIINYPDNTAGKPAVMTANYVAIDGLYYQITNKERLPGNALAIYATLDGLLSYWNYVKNCPVIFARSSNEAAPDFQDPKFVIECGYETDTINIGSLGDGSTIVLGYVK